MNKHGTLGKLGDIGGKATSAIGDEFTNIVKTAKTQITGIEEIGTEKPKINQSQASTSAPAEKPSSEQDQAFLKGMYGLKPDEKAPSVEQAQMQNKMSKTKDDQKLQEVRAQVQRLHREAYFDPLIEQVERPDNEERPQERAERLDEEERKEDWVKKKKEEEKAPISVHRAQRTAEMGRNSG